MVVAGGLWVAMMENCWWLQGRLFQLWHCVRDQTEQIEKIPPPPPHTHFIFIFALFCVDMGHFLIFLYFFYVYKFWDFRYREKKEKEESSHRPATRIFVRKNRHTVFICIDLKFTFSCVLPTWKINSWSVRVVYCGCRYVRSLCVWLST